MEITREYLSKYIYLQKEIERLRKKKKRVSEFLKVTEHGVVKGSMNQFPYAEAHFVVSGIGMKCDKEKQSQRAQLLIDIKANEEIAETMQIEIEKFIENIDDLEMRQIFEMKYIDGMKDREIADELCYSREAIGKKIDNRTRVPQLPE